MLDKTVALTCCWASSETTAQSTDTDSCEPRSSRT